MSEIEMILREPPPLIEFTRGEVVEGTLLAVRRAKLKDGSGWKYWLRRDDGKVVTFWGVHQINEVLIPGDPDAFAGYRVSLAYLGDDATVGRGENKMKHFEVRTSARPVRAAQSKSASVDPLEITNEDIPF